MSILFIRAMDQDLDTRIQFIPDYKPEEIIMSHGYSIAYMLHFGYVMNAFPDITMQQKIDYTKFLMGETMRKYER